MPVVPVIVTRVVEIVFEPRLRDADITTRSILVRWVRYSTSNLSSLIDVGITSGKDNSRSISVGGVCMVSCVDFEVKERVTVADVSTGAFVVWANIVGAPGDEVVGTGIIIVVAAMPLLAAVRVFVVAIVKVELSLLDAMPLVVVTVAVLVFVVVLVVVEKHSYTLRS